MELNEAYKKVCDEVLKNSYKNDVNSAILALHESATKIWQGVENGEKDKINNRIASLLISIFYIAQELGIKNIEECLNQKLEELKKSDNLK